MWARIRRIVMFGGVSVFTTILDLAIFNALISTTTSHPFVANTISYGAGIVASYELNRRYTFGGRGLEKRSHELVIFFALNLVGLALTGGAVALAQWAFPENTLLLNAAKIAAGALVWLFKFVSFGRWVYPDAQPGP